MDTNRTNQTFALAFPLPEPLISRIIGEKRTVVARFESSRTKKTRLCPGTLMVFYQSGGLKSVVGEATIENIDIETAQQVMQHYGHRFFLDESELKSYSNKYPGREQRPLMVFELGSPRWYATPVRWPFPITMRGRHMSEAEYNNLFVKV